MIRLACTRCSTHWTLPADEHGCEVWPNADSEELALRHTDQHGALTWHRLPEAA